MTEIEEFENFHPRAIKLLRKRKNFLVIACDEPYFLACYDLIRQSEMAKGTWTPVDESCYIRSAEQRNDAETGIPAATNNSAMMECGNCGVPRFVHEETLEKCPNCGDDEFDLSLIGDAP